MILGFVDYHVSDHMCTLKSVFSNIQMQVRYNRNSPEGKKANTDLAGGYRGILLFLIGDMDYLSKTLELPRWSRNVNLCSLCRCTKYGPLSWAHNNLQDAGWLNEIWEPSDWRAWDGRSMSPIFDLPWLSSANIFLDYMQCKFLGSDQYLFGSVLYLICFVILADNAKANLSKVWGWAKAFYKENKTKNKYRGIRKLSMLVRKKDYPKLRGKAAEVKGFGVVALHLWEKVMDKKLTIHRQIRLLLDKNLELDKILDAYPTTAGYLALPQDVADRFKTTMFSVGQLHKQVSDHFKSTDIKVFNMTGKTRMLMHLGLLAEHVHPTLGWCFQSEGFMRVVQTLLQSCVRGNHAVGAMGKATVHYNLGKQLQYMKAKL